MVLQGYVLAILIEKKAYREYPAFSTCRAVGLAENLMFLYFASYHSSLYQKVQWTTYPLGVVTVVVLVWEVFYILFHPFSSLPKQTISHFIQAVFAICLVSILFAIRFPGAQPTLWMTFARATDQVVTWVLCGVFGFIAIFARYFGIPWRHRVFGIAAGYLLYLGVDVAVTTAIVQFHIPPYSRVGMLSMFAYLLACLIWAYYFAKPEEPRLLPNLEQLEKLQTIVGSHAIAMKEARIDERPRSDKPWGGQ
jgi:hypothetical protein